MTTFNVQPKLTEQPVRVSVLLSGALAVHGSARRATATEHKKRF